MISGVGKNIKRERIKNKISMEELSRKANIGISTISEIESGKRKELRSETIVKIAKALEVDIDVILGKNLIDKNNSTDLLNSIKLMVNSSNISINDESMNEDEKERFISLTEMYVNSVIGKRKK